VFPLSLARESCDGLGIVLWLTTGSRSSQCWNIGSTSRGWNIEELVTCLRIYNVAILLRIIEALYVDSASVLLLNPRRLHWWRSLHHRFLPRVPKFDAPGWFPFLYRVALSSQGSQLLRGAVYESPHSGRRRHPLPRCHLCLIPAAHRTISHYIATRTLEDDMRGNTITYPLDEDDQTVAIRRS
jgi:hypothetical protein